MHWPALRLELFLSTDGNWCSIRRSRRLLVRRSRAEPWARAGYSNQPMI
jgi:hypothetical protein